MIFLLVVKKLTIRAYYCRVKPSSAIDPTVDTLATRRYRPMSENKAEAAMTETKTELPDDLQQKVEEIAREQERKPSEVVEDAVRRYVAVRRLEQLAEKGEERARARGIREEDVPRLVEEVRRGNRDRGR
jgi:predicted transcriptional regulator